jgi:hypothetical protein
MKKHHQARSAHELETKMNNIDNWSLIDSHSDKAINDIEPFSERAISLIARNRSKPLLKIGFINLMGAIEMLGGLEYHYDNIVRICSEIAEGNRPDTAGICINHEAAAYINRIGQFYYFAISQFARLALADPDSAIPTLCKFLVFRNKHTAHRSIDAPRGESETVKLYHARSVSSTLGSLFSAKKMALQVDLSKMATQTLEEKRRGLWRDYYRTFQMVNEDGSSMDFTIQIEHPDIVREAYAVIERIVLHA